VQLAQEDHEAWEHLKADRASEEYMANLRRNNPNHVTEEVAEFARYEQLCRNGGGGGAEDDLNFSVFDD
jgi:hypothetical protein